MGAIALCSIQCMGQKFFTRNGHLGFFSKTNMEDIKANNESVTYIMDLSTGEMSRKTLFDRKEITALAVPKLFQIDYTTNELLLYAVFGRNERFGVMKINE